MATCSASGKAGRGTWLAAQRLAAIAALGYHGAIRDSDWNAMTGWIYLGIAIVLEIVATTMLKLSDGLARWQWAAASIALYALCFIALAPALKTIPVGVAYAIWSGIGIVAIAIIGVIWFDQRLTPLQIGFMALLIIGAIGLRASSPS